ncbi:MAG: zinc ribbon domain-containing protein [Gammaproteobacteria bacterium]|nr:MAG: zinc ribbon domain-containing protein [Gammaproteobacteria bacterium]UCH39015.1 MAG: zinc ribbon domain-containing protein [Gammaproteobacteria bacterium]
MPIYEYICGDCGHEFDKLQKMSDAPLRDCPACDEESLKKKISAPGFRLSGSGWYETDFKSDKQKNLSKGDSADKGTSNKPDKAADGSKAKSSTSPGKEAAA